MTASNFYFRVMDLFYLKKHNWRKIVVVLLCSLYGVTATAQDSLSQYILTPKPGPAPRITGPKVFGVRPGHPIVFTISARGDRPMTFTAEGLPKTVKLDAKTGQISGSISKPGEYVVTLHAKNKKDKATRELKIVVGEALVLTPPMGWNSWNVYATRVTQELVFANAKAMVSFGLIDHEYR
jgi:alpha-galactosidase